jgi:A/G-specific adenine glycosylase
VAGPQSRFEGSHRQGRGRLVDALRSGNPVPRCHLADATGWPGDDSRARRAADSLVADGLAMWTADGSLALPD